RPKVVFPEPELPTTDTRRTWSPYRAGTCLARDFYDPRNRTRGGTMSMSRSWPRLAGAAVVGALASAAVLVLAGAGPVSVAQAAPVPAPQASCPAPVDPRAISRTTNAFARIDGIQGDSTSAAHAGD